MAGGPQIDSGWSGPRCARDVINATCRARDRKKCGTFAAGTFLSLHTPTLPQKITSADRSPVLNPDPNRITYGGPPTSANLRPKTRHTTPTPQPHHATFQHVVYIPILIPITQTVTEPK